MQHQHTRDPATGLQNFFGFLQGISSALAAGAGVVVAYDINGLRQLNITHGREAGDRCTDCLARLLAGAATGAGQAFRLRRDEFALLLPGRDRQAGLQVARHVADEYGRITAGMGLASSVRSAVVPYPERAQSPGELLCAMDFTLQRPAQAGPNPETIHPDQLPDWVRSLIDDMVDRVLETLGLLRQAREMAFTDAVSGLPNHRAAADHLAAQLQAHARTRRDLSILFIDGDRLKAYNERLGYQAGNEMIQQLGQVLAAGVRAGDYVARWLSGDEFLVVLPGTGRATAISVAERLRSAVEIASRAWPLPVTVSVGVATFPADGEESEELLRRAAEANAAAKRQGRNRVE